MDTPGQWWHRAEGKRAIALVLKDNREHAAEAWDACGMAVEFALKAYILEKERLNRWPDRESRPDLYTHDLRRLMKVAGLRQQDVPPVYRASLAMVLGWSREHSYKPGRMPRKQARDMFASTFETDGVLQWLKSL